VSDGSAVGEAGTCECAEECRWSTVLSGTFGETVFLELEAARVD
jgi:hypothetical protein